MNKQIEEMAKVIYDEFGTMVVAEADATAISVHLTRNGYCKASDVASEIFAEIEQEISAALKSNYKVLPQVIDSDELYHTVQGKISALCGIEGFIAELKKKYESEGAE